jgi:hypothetical protein
MNISEILITVALTVAAAVAIAYTTFKLQARHRERGLFKALLTEIEYNRLRLESFVGEWSLWSKEKSDHPPEAPLLFSEAYEALRLSGQLLKLHEGVRTRLNNTLSLVAVHNLRVSEAGLNYSKALGHDTYLQGRMNRIFQDLQALENELAKDMEMPTSTKSTKKQRTPLSDWKENLVFVCILFGATIWCVDSFGARLLSILAHSFGIGGAVLAIFVGIILEYNPETKRGNLLVEIKSWVQRKVAIHKGLEWLGEHRAIRFLLLFIGVTLALCGLILGLAATIKSQSML